MSCYGELFPNSLASFAAESAIGFAASGAKRVLRGRPPDRRLSQKPVRFTFLKASRTNAFAEPDPLRCVDARAIFKPGNSATRQRWRCFHTPGTEGPYFCSIVQIATKEKGYDY